MNEYDTIRRLLAQFPRGAAPENQVFECDAELVRIGGELWGLTLDEFSAEEDRFGSADPAALGANLAVATLSDLLAAGAEPRFFLQALAVPRAAPPDWLDGLARGIRSVLDAAGCTLCGGDLGTADPWRFTGFAMGPVTAPAPLTRRIPHGPHTLWVTGALGDANAAILQGRPAPAFELRLREAALIRRHAGACIDTSGGLMDAVWLLHERSPAAALELDLDRIPFAPGVREAAAAAGIPPGAALLGGAGEYELLCAAPAALPEAAQSELRGAGMTAIGTVRAGAAGGVRFVRGGKPVATMDAPPPCPRASVDAAGHVREVVQRAMALFGPGAGP